MDETVNRPSQAASILPQTKQIISGRGSTVPITSKASSSTDLQTHKVQMPCRLPVAGQAAPPAMGHEERRAESFRGSPSSSDDVLPQGHHGKHFPHIKQHMTVSPRAKVVRMGLREGMNLSQQQQQGQVLSREGQHEEVPPVDRKASNTADSASSIIPNSTLASISPAGRFQGMLEGQALLSVKTKTPLSPTRPPSQHAVLPGPRPSDISEQYIIKGGLTSVWRPAAAAPSSTSAGGCLLPNASQDQLRAPNGSGRPHSPSVTSSVDRILVQHILTRRQQQQEGGGQSTKGQCQRLSKSQAFLLTGNAEPRRRSTSPGKWR